MNKIKKSFKTLTDFINFLFFIPQLPLPADYHFCSMPSVNFFKEYIRTYNSEKSHVYRVGFVF